MNDYKIKITEPDLNIDKNDKFNNDTHQLNVMVVGL